MRRVRVALAYIIALFSTSQYARDMSVQRRRKIAQQIMRLAELRGWDVLATNRIGYSVASVGRAPSVGGVYRVFDGDELVYIGAAWGAGGLSARLNDHLKDNEPNRDLFQFLATGEAIVEWYACQAPGWVEDYELTEFREEYGRLPRYNKKQAGAVVRGWWY